MKRASAYVFEVNWGQAIYHNAETVPSVISVRARIPSGRPADRSGLRGRAAAGHASANQRLRRTTGSSSTTRLFHPRPDPTYQISSRNSSADRPAHTHANATSVMSSRQVMPLSWHSLKRPQSRVAMAAPTMKRIVKAKRPNSACRKVSRKMRKLRRYEAVRLHRKRAVREEEGAGKRGG